jgi:hypothetical protein
VTRAPVSRQAFPVARLLLENKLNVAAQCTLQEISGKNISGKFSSLGTQATQPVLDSGVPFSHGISV